jgi:hypothetical protein
LSAAFKPVVLGCLLLLALISQAWSRPVDQATARQVAETMLERHVALYGSWNGSPAPTISEGHAVAHKGLLVAYNFQVAPTGHVLVAVDDVFSPVQLYSARAFFDPARADRVGSLESWIVPALHQEVGALATDPAIARGMVAGDDAGQARIQNAWRDLTAAAPASGAHNPAQATLADERAGDAYSVGPLLSTAWDQDTPYNLFTPSTAACANTLTGCVATAWAQLMHYWRWPIQGQGSHSYEWQGQTLSVAFDVAYDWVNMPDTLTPTSSQDEKEAVAQLMYHLGVAAERDYGCVTSGSWIWADDVLDTYFRYKSSMRRYSRAAFTSAEWLALIADEINEQPPRPVILSIYSPESGHEVVVDGYQVGPTDMVHINFGWSGFYDGWLNITSAFTTTPYTWSAERQNIIVGIEPDYASDTPAVTPNLAAETGAGRGSGGGGCFIASLGNSP